MALAFRRQLNQKIFNPFYTTKPAGEGTGLGLSTSYEIINKVHKGKLEVESKKGEFTEFSFTIPKKIV
jgi:signal transduction histidine kinase